MNLADFIAKLGIVTPQFKAKIEALAAQYPDGQIPLEVAAQMIAMHLSAENLLAKVPEFIKEALALVREGPKDATHHSSDFHR